MDLGVVLAHHRQSAALRVAWRGNHAVRHLVLKREEHRDPPVREDVLLGLHLLEEPDEEGRGHVEREVAHEGDRGQGPVRPVRRLERGEELGDVVVEDVTHVDLERAPGGVLQVGISSVLQNMIQEFKILGILEENSR